MGLYENMQKEPVSQLTLREPVTVPPEAPVREAVGKMRERKLGCVVAVDEAGKPCGVFTESMLTQLLAQNPAALDEMLRDHMSAKWPWVKLNDKIVVVLEALETKNVRFLSVVDESGRLVGLTGQKGLMEYVADHFPEQVMVQRIGVAPYPHDREGA